MIADASVAFKWLVREADSEAAIALIASGESMTAPTLLIAEVGHALTKRVRMGELIADEVGEQFRRLPGLLTLFEDAPYVDRAMELSLALHHSFYDCVYLSMALANTDVLVTADTRFAAKVDTAGMEDRIRLLGRGS